jgi:hypothetical protein
MKIKSQNNGINISAFINTDELERNLLAPYKERVKVLEAQVKKRDYYIKNMHFQLRKRKWIIYLGYISNSLMKPLPNKLNIKRMMVLFYMYERNFTSVEKIKKDFSELNVPCTGMITDMNYFIKSGLATRDGRGFYYLLDKGREVVEYYEKNMLKRFLHMAKIKQDITQMKNPNDSLKKPTKYSEDEIKSRRITYTKLMKPFWESGYKIMPKDKGKRIDILAKWIKEHNIQDEWYNKLIFNWGSKSK